MRLSWLLRGPGWRRGHVHYCQKCWRKFADTEPGCVAPGDERFLELCHCPEAYKGWHTDCRASGPYCPACAAKAAEEAAEVRRIAELYNGS